MIGNIKQIIKNKTYTFVAADEHSIIYQSSEKGITPIISPMRTNQFFFRGKCVADTKIGKAAALLLVQSGATYVYGEVMSQSAVLVLQQHGIPFEYETLVAYIKNRECTGMCPLEECIQYEHDLFVAWTKIENKISEIMNATESSATLFSEKF